MKTAYPRRQRLTGLLHALFGARFHLFQTMIPTAVTFDVGQTLTSLHTPLLAERLQGYGAKVELDRLEAGLPLAWSAYDEAVRKPSSTHSWKVFMATLLREAGVEPGRLEEWVDRLQQEQRQRNLWRQPVAGMIELVDALVERGVPVGIVSNSEGRLESLLEELGWRERFVVVADSGCLGIEKPDPRIFHWACERMGVKPGQVVHVGDSRAADVEGAIGAGMKAIWFRTRDEEGGVRPEVRTCTDAAELRGALRAWGMVGG